jgi:hypothetical protein
MSVFVGWGANPNIGFRLKEQMLGFAPQPTVAMTEQNPDNARPCADCLTQDSMVA